MTEFLLGASAMGSAVITLVFFRYWKKTGDRLFLAFGAAFVAFTANRVGQAISDRDSERLLGIYSLRLLAFLLIVAAIVDRNRR
jgi:hypothetical protein